MIERKVLTERDVERLLREIGRDERERPLTAEEERMLEEVKRAVLGKDGGQ